MHAAPDRRAAGFTLVETMATLALAAATLTVAVVLTLPTVQRREVHDAAVDTQLCLRAARMESVRRNRSCACRIDTAGRQLTVLDGMGTAVTTDDVALKSWRYPQRVVFGAPGGDPPVTLATVGGGFACRFNATGRVTDGVGHVTLFGGEEYARTSVFASGGTRIDTWNVHEAEP